MCPTARDPASAAAFSRRVVLAALLSVACAGEPPSQTPAIQRRLPPVQFEFYAQDGSRHDSASTRGRATVLLFLTTYDLNSQLVARRVEDLLHTFHPRFNALAVVVEPAKYAVLVEPFKQSLGLSYPVVLADQDTLTGEGPFGPVAEVPVLVVLDREGRPLWRVNGAATEKQLTKALKSASGYVKNPSDPN